MSARLADKKKRQTVIAACLFVIIIGLVIWDFHGPALVPPRAAQARVDLGRVQHKSAKTAAASALPSSFHLQLERLARSEGFDYAGDGHNLFGSPTRVAIEAPIASARPLPVTNTAVPLAVVKSEPRIEVKYEGLAESELGKIHGLFVRGDDISVASTGDIIFHRFRVGSILATSARLTDLVSNQGAPLVVARTE